MFMPVQDLFIKNVTIRMRKEEGVKYRVKAQWATEDKMRDVLKLKELLGYMHPNPLNTCVCIQDITAWR